MGNYDDIINLPHHVSKKHPQMSIDARAAQFSPFAALTGYDATIAETGRLTDDRIELDENEKVILDEKFKQLLYAKKDSEVIITYFIPDDKKSGGKYLRLQGKVAKINTYDKIVTMDNKTNIKIDDIIDIEFGGN